MNHLLTRPFDLVRLFDDLRIYASAQGVDPNHRLVVRISDRAESGALEEVSTLTVPPLRISPQTIDDADEDDGWRPSDLQR